MATRFYFPSGTTAPVLTLPYSDVWGMTTGAIQAALDTARRSSDFQTIGVEETHGSFAPWSSYPVLLAQYVSKALEAGVVFTDSDTIKGQFRAMESDAAANMNLAIFMEIFDSSGEFITVLYDLRPISLGGATEFALALTNRYFPPSDVLQDNYTTVGGERLVISIGYSAFNTVVTPYTGSLEIGDDSGSDLPEDESSTDQFCPWVEVSTAITFESGGGGGGGTTGKTTVAGDINVGGLGFISRYTTPKAVVGSGGVKIDGVGVVVSKKPEHLAIVGSGGIRVAGQGVIVTKTPSILEVVGSGGVKIDGQGVISRVPPKIDAHVGSGGIKIDGKGVIASGALQILDVVGSGGIKVDGAGVVATKTPSVLEIIGKGGIKVGEFRVPELTVVKVIYPADLTTAITGSGGIKVGGVGVITGEITPPIYEVPGPKPGEDANLFVGGAGVIAFIHPAILEVIAEGEVVIGGAPVGGEVYETFVLTGARGEPSIYSNFKFNSYAKYRNQYFGAGPDGIYLLEGEDDAGKEIHPGVRVGPVNFGTDRQKRLRLLRCGGKTSEAQVKVSDDNGGAGYYDVDDSLAEASMKVQGRELTIEIADFSTLDHLEILPLILVK